MPNELGDFLRARRADPALGIPAHDPQKRRRTPGLRREEVAAAAGISVDYYIRLEQGRENRPSDPIMDALARALHLTSDARDHLYRLRGTARASDWAEPVEDDTVLARMEALVQTVRPNPAYVLDRLSNMVAVNEEGLALYDGIADLPPERRNTCRYLMTDPRAQHTFVEWDEIARGAVAHLRAANASSLQDPQLQALVTELSEASPLFAKWWNEHTVQRRRASTKHLRTSDGGIVTRQYEILNVPDEAFRVTLWLPGASSQT